MATVSDAINGGGVAEGSGDPGNNNDSEAAVVVVVVDGGEQVAGGGHNQGAHGGGGVGGGIEALEAAHKEAAELTAGELPHMLSFAGTSVTNLAITAFVTPPKHLSSHKFLPAAYYMALFLLFLFGVALIVMSVWVSGNPPRRSAASKAVLRATLAPLLLVLSLATLAMI